MAISGINTRALHSATVARQSSMQQITSGQKVGSASIDASAYAISVRMDSRIAAVHQSNQNTQNTNAMLKVASGGVENTINALSTLRSNLLNAANDTNTSTDRSHLQKMVDSTIATVNDNASIEYNGKALLNGSTPPIVTASYRGAQDTTNLGNLSSEALGLSDARGKSLLDLSTKDGIANALDTVDQALNAALDQATSIGASRQGLHYQSANFTTESENLTSSMSTIQDADIAKLAVDLSNAKVQERAALFAQKAQMQNSYAALALLR